MTSIIILMISTIAIIAITGDAVDLDTNRELLEKEGCPYLENGEHVVTIKGSGLVITGRAYINYNSSDTKPQSYSLWFENKHHVEPNFTEHGVVYFNFYCISKVPSSSADIKKGRMFISQVWPYDEAANNTENLRCALYEKIDHYNTTLRVAISKSSSCDGLSNMLHHPEQIPWNINGSRLMIFNMVRPTTTTTTTTTESIQSIAERYEKRGYILQNFGNRPNPFHRKNRETNDDGKSCYINVLFKLHGAIVTILTTRTIYYYDKAKVDLLFNTKFNFNIDHVIHHNIHVIDIVIDISLIGFLINVELQYFRYFKLLYGVRAFGVKNIFRIRAMYPKLNKI
ncbi:hypothetical protein QTP88_019062 [Uroleucon formosanum]